MSGKRNAIKWQDEDGSRDDEASKENSRGLILTSCEAAARVKPKARPVYTPLLRSWLTPILLDSALDESNNRRLGSGVSSEVPRQTQS
jgi:hypothetical protein